MNVFSADVALAIARLGLLILLGWFLAHRGWVGPHARQPLMRLGLWVFFPALIFDRVSSNPLIHSGPTALLYLGAGFLMIIVGILVGRAVAALFRFPPGDAKRTFAYASGINNFGYLGIPVTAALFDQDVVGVLLVHNVGVEAAVWTFGVAFLSGAPPGKSLKQLAQPMTVALAVALAINFAGLGETAAIHFAGQFCHTIGECAIPIGTILTGIYLHETLQGFKFIADARVSFGVMAVRWLAMPVILLSVACWFITDPALRKVMMVQAAMPAGIFTFLIVELYRGDVSVALRVAVVTVAFCPLITPLWLYVGSRWLGL
jgi:malate permease and related proteins